MSDDPYEVRITIIDQADPNEIILDIESGPTTSVVASDWLAFIVNGGLMETVPGTTYVCRTYLYGSGVAVEEATTTV